jgi:hypothetical protein
VGKPAGYTGKLIHYQNLRITVRERSRVMKTQPIRFATTFAVTALSAALFAGCADSGSNEYSPNATPAQLAAYAARVQYPTNMQPQDDQHLIAEVNRTTGRITLRNFSNTPLRDFNLWVNQNYVLHVNQVDANGSRSVDPADLYNYSGSNMEKAAPESIRKVQVQTADGMLYNVQGPQLQ